MLEAHLTVRWPKGAEALSAWIAARGLGLTYLRIGDAPVTSMITGRWPLGLAEAIEVARGHASALIAEGAAVERIKIEAEIDSPIVALYLEHHVKVRYPISARAQIAAIAVEAGAHFSSTASKVEQAIEERFLTRRYAANEGEREDEELALLLGALAVAPIEVVKVERERALYDDDPSADDRWLGAGR
jgi:hypothetical protein